MSETIQAQYTERVQRYGRLIHGTDQFALLAKLQIYRSFLEKQRLRGDNLWAIEPLLPYLLMSLEQDIHLTLAKFFDDNGGYSLRRFLDFCLSNTKHIFWNDANPPSDILFAQKQALEGHSATINAIKARRDKVYAHSDKQYLDDRQMVFQDYPLTEDDIVSLANCMISIIHKHEDGLHPGKWSFHLAEAFEISVDNMVRNLEAGRRQNFPQQSWD